MSPASIDACLLDYGNTLIPFDREQIRTILTSLCAELSRQVAPLAYDDLQRATGEAHALPHVGEPPGYEELQPVEQMRFVLRRAYDGRAEITPAQCEATNRLLQALFVEVVTIAPSVVSALEELGSICRVGMVSNYPCGDAIRRSLDDVGIRHLLDPIVVSGDVGYVKPHAAPFRAALAQLSADPSRVLFVGDRWDMDMVGASALGMRTCHITGMTSDHDFEERYARYRPDWVIDRFEELPAIVRGD